MASEYVEQRESNYFVTGSRVSLDSIVYSFLNGESPETIQNNFPTLSLEQVYGAIAYYLAHRVDVDAYLQKKAQGFEAARRSQEHVTGELRSRLSQARQESPRLP